MLEIDGSYGEGGGQVLRTSLTLAALTGQPVQMHQVRAGRRSRGLAPQHLATVLATAQVCAAEVRGASIGSTEVTFVPQSRPQPGTYAVDVAQAAHTGSAGAVTLILQTLLLPLAFSSGPSTLHLRGGTHVAWSPPFDYISQIYLPILARLGVHAQCRLGAWGFYPLGGGQLTAEIRPLTTAAARPAGPRAGGAALNAASEGPGFLEPGPLQRVTGQAVACNLPSHIAQRMADRATSVLKAENLRATVTPVRVQGIGPGAAIFLLAGYDTVPSGFAGLGAKGKPSEQVAEEACEALLAHHASGAAIDPHLADQLLLPLALAPGRSQFTTGRVTQHLLTNAHVIEQFVPARIEVVGQEDEPGLVTVEGIGLAA
jgi:RNA 3'-terminal phosphate cyclase (ATP)